MKYFVIFLVLFCLSSLSFGQRQADNWIWGLCSPENGCPEPFGSGIMKFNDIGLESITSSNFQYRINKGSASISDSTGNLLLVFNGKYLFDSSGEIIDSFYTGDFSEMSVGFKNSLFLNKPGSANNYCLFNSFAKSLNGEDSISAFDSSFYYSEFRINNLDIETQIRKQFIPLDSSGSGTIAAIRHGNGRDWWIMKSSIYQDKFYQALLDPYGFEFNAVYTPISHAYQPGGGWNLFSSDGLKFINIITGNFNKAYVYDFNRCTGVITNPIEHDLNPYFNSDAVNACCLSPDGSKLYFRRSNMKAFLTIELCQYDFETSFFNVIAEGHSAPSLTPNNKWVVAPYVDISVNPYNPQLSIVYQPNEANENINFVPQVFNLINYGFIEVSPNYANFRLGPLPNSDCDTLITHISPEINFSSLQTKIYPNPVSSALTIDQEISSICNLKISNIFGQIVWQGQSQYKKTVLTKEIERLENGIYWIEIQDLKTGKRTGKMFVKQ